MDYMTATEEMRRMLDERGVEWRKAPHYSGESQDNETIFEGNGIEWYANDHLNGRLGLRTARYEVTPEQAIDATLGHAYEPPLAAHWDGDTLTLTIPRDPSCIRVQRSAEQPCKVYADESKVIAATLGDSDATGARQRDAVEVVRCRDCESAIDHCEGMDVYWCEYLSRYVGADTFCAWASRKESE